MTAFCESFLEGEGRDGLSGRFLWLNKDRDFLGDYQMPAYICTEGNEDTIPIPEGDIPKAESNLVAYAAKKLGIPASLMNEWLEWKIQGQPCRAHKKSGEPCKGVVHSGYISPRKFDPEHTPYCAYHRHPASRGMPMVGKISSRVGPSPYSPGFVYLIRAMGTPRYKIGLSERPCTRRSKLVRQSPYPLEIVAEAYTSSMKESEGYWHKQFESTRAFGEWFELTECQVSEFLAFAQQFEDAP